jgi:hypothetical protein
MLDLGFGPGDSFVGLGQFLHIIDAGRHWIMISLCGPNPEHVKDNLGIPGIILVPAIVKRFPCPGESHRRYETGLQPRLPKPPGDWSVIIAGCLKGANNRCVKGPQCLDQPIVINPVVQN